MIGCTKLICGQATVSDIIKYGQKTNGLPANMLQFSSNSAPIVVWNVTKQCNLFCRHCYITADNTGLADELSTVEAKVFIDDLAKIKVPVLLFSGGEPLLRADIFELAQYAARRGLRPVLSTNGTLIDCQTAERINKAGFQYVGVSIDGDRRSHDHFRGREGAFDLALAGIRNSLAAGNKTGIRFTINKLNYHTLPEILALVEREKINRFCMYHLVYAGRAKEMADLDTTPDQKNKIIEFLIEKTLDFARRGVETEILTTDNHADGIRILQYFEHHQPERVPEIRELLAMHGGCSAGQKMANVDPRGDVHACQFWGHKSLGNVRQTPFSTIWTTGQNEFLAALREKDRKLAGRCGECRYKTLCGGCRIRAEAVSGNIWGEDPACYLTEWKEQ